MGGERGFGGVGEWDCAVEVVGRKPVLVTEMKRSSECMRAGSVLTGLSGAREDMAFRRLDLSLELSGHGRIT